MAITCPAAPPLPCAALDRLAPTTQSTCHHSLLSRLWTSSTRGGSVICAHTRVRRTSISSSPRHTRIQFSVMGDGRVLGVSSPRTRSRQFLSSYCRGTILVSDLRVKERVESGRGRARSVLKWVTILTLQHLSISETGRCRRDSKRKDPFSLTEII